MFFLKVKPKCRQKNHDELFHRASCFYSYLIGYFSDLYLKLFFYWIDFNALKKKIVNIFTSLIYLYVRHLFVNIPPNIKIKKVLVWKKTVLLTKTAAKKRIWLYNQAVSVSIQNSFKMIDWNGELVTGIAIHKTSNTINKSKTQI